MMMLLLLMLLLFVVVDVIDVVAVADHDTGGVYYHVVDGFVVVVAVAIDVAFVCC